ncbi:MAG: peptide-methionine (R)-S-oxide reductase [Candidatus Saccharibacteria bacterium]|nr:peptide-methionine (R)-S-oxide reductase [Candidatus Saccharibacteria bacterium]
MPQTEDEWKAKLTPEQYAVLREKGTDAPFSGALVNNHDTGDYMCAACGSKLFDSTTKFESGSGWPSFYDPANKDAVKLIEDNSLGMSRTEVVCATCGGHLGHLFNDAYDQPTGNRFCMNSTSLAFKPKS